MKTLFISAWLRLIVLGGLLGGTVLLAAEPEPKAYLVFACDGGAREQQYLREQTGSWTVNQTRAFATNLGRAVYSVPLGKARLERLRYQVNLVPYRLEFSGDGKRWELLVSTAGATTEPGKFSAQSVGFTAAQCEAAGASGVAWFRLQPASGTAGATLQLQYFRLEVKGRDLPPHFIRPAWWHALASWMTGMLMAAVGLAPWCYAWVKWRIPARVIGGGALLWVVSVALKFGFAMVTNAPVNRWLHACLGTSWANPIFWCYLGVLTGIFECGIFLALAAYIRRRSWSWPKAVALGLGFGGMEAIALAVIAVLQVSEAVSWGSMTEWSEVMVPAFERLIALLIHVATVVMILRALLDRRWTWFWVGFFYKSAVDAVAAWLLLSGTKLLSSPWLMEWVCFAPFALMGLILLLPLRRGWAEGSQPEGEPVGNEPAVKNTGANGSTH